MSDETNKNKEATNLKSSVSTTGAIIDPTWIDTLKVLDPKEYQQLSWVYYDAKYRCNRVAHKSYKNYGARGIKFLFNSFEEWLAYMGPRPVGFEMDRIDNNGNYEVGNLQWTDFSTQQKNKRVYSSNTSGIKGVNFVTTIQEWVVRCNNNKNGKRDYLYVGKDFFEACCARRSWESNQSEVKIRNRRGKDFERDKHKLGV